MRRLLTCGAAALFTALSACGDTPSLDPKAGIGPNPTLPEPHYFFFTPVKIADVVGWAGNDAPKAAPGLAVTRFAADLAHPRWLYVLPNGDVLVAESDGDPEPTMRPKSLFQALFMKQAKGGTKPGQRILLLRDADGDGLAETRTVFIAKLHAPFGMTLVGNQLYVGETDALRRFTYTEGATSIAGSGTKVTDLPGGPINHHWTKNVIASRDGSKLYVSVGSNSNVGENGMEYEAGRAAIWEVDPATGAHRVYASGIRNPNGMDWEPSTGALWTVANERDEIGDDLVPDYITSVRPGGFYGWPYSYYGQHIDKRAYPQRPDLVARAIKPDYAVGSHAGSLGFTFANKNSLGPRFREGAFVGQHGSWNRSRPFGYKVVFIPFAGGKPSGMPIDVLNGFLNGANAHGRPVGVVIDKRGGLLVADDAGNAVWRVAAKPSRYNLATQPKLITTGF
jgi:glucose/arabinose dehydrogenase